MYKHTARLTRGSRDACRYTNTKSVAIPLRFCETTEEATGESRETESEIAGNCSRC